MPMTDTELANVRERIEAAADALWPSAARSDRDNIHWIGGADAGPDWCESCAEREVVRLRAENPRGEFFVDGGYDAGHNTEHSASSEGCGRPLNYVLLRYGVISEVDHFLENPWTEDDGPDVAYEIHALLEGAKWMREHKDHDLIADALRVGEAAVQLIGYRYELARLADDGGPA